MASRLKENIAPGTEKESIRVETEGLKKGRGEAGKRQACGITLVGAGY